MSIITLTTLGCSDSIALGSDVLWSADHETSNLDQWTEGSGGGLRLPSEESTILVTEALAHRGRRAVELTNPANWSKLDEGPELFHVAGFVPDAYYSAWFYLPENYRLGSSMTVMRLRSKAVDSEELLSGEELQLRSVVTGGYVLQVFSHNAAFLLEPVADPAPHVEAQKWFHIEARYEPRADGRLRVWLNGVFVYDLEGRPAAAGQSTVFSVCNVAEASQPAPLRLLVDDAVISASRVSPRGVLTF